MQKENPILRRGTICAYNPQARWKFGVTLTLLSMVCHLAQSAHYTTTVQQGSGAHWHNAIWQPGTVAPAGGNTYECLTRPSSPPTRIRCPASDGVQTFVGDSLTMDYSSEIRVKKGSTSPGNTKINFPGIGGNPGLILNGGNLDVGDGTWICGLQGVILVTANSTFTCGDATSTSSRGWRIEGELRGTAGLTVSNKFVNELAMEITSLNNPYTGTWTLEGGIFRAAGVNSLGFGNIVINPGASGAVFEPMYDVKSPGTLTLAAGNTRMTLHQNCTFSAVTIAGTPLSAGTHTYANLVTDFPNSFNAGGSGSITVGPVTPVLLASPADQSVIAGATATFSVTAVGTEPLSYTWLTNNQVDPNFTASTYSFAPSTNDKGKTFSVIVGNAAGSVTSLVATLTVISPEVQFTSQPGSLSRNEYETATFAVTTLGAPTITYQWYTNSGSGFVAIPGATGPGYTTPALQPVPYHGLEFMVVAANTYGSATSGVATLSVTADTAAPYVSSVLQDLVGGNGHRVQVVFSEPVLPGTATNLSNYAMNGGLVVTNITLLDDLRTAILHCSSTIAPGGSYSVEVSDVLDMAQAPNMVLGATTPLYPWTSTIQRLNVRRLAYTNLSASTAITNLLTEPKVNGNTPDMVDYLSTIDYPAGSTTDVGDHSRYNYGLRITGYIIPSSTANYVFHILSDDEGRFLLSTDENPANLQAVVRYGDGSCCGSGFDSAPIPLTAGRAYYMEAWMKQAGGGDGLHVTWKTTGSFTAIPSANLVFAYRPDLLLQITDQPVPMNLVEGQSANFRVGVFSTEQGLTYQWQANGVDIPDATNAVYDARVTGSMSSSSIRCLVSSRLETGILAGSIPLSVTSEAAPLTVLGTPMNLTVIGSANSLTVTWDSVADATNYVLSRASSLAGPYTDILVTSSTSFVQSGLAAGTVYYYRVASQGALGQTAYSEPVAGYTIPPAPINLAAVPGDTRVTLNWSPTPGALWYDVRRALSATGPFENLDTVWVGTSYFDSGLTNFTEYYYVVRAGNYTGLSFSSAVVSAIPSSAPTGVGAAGGTNAIFVQWAEMPGAQNYNVKRANASGGPYTTVATAVSGTSHLDTTSLASGTTYYYIVSATISGSESGNSLEANAFTAPSAPTGLTIIATNYTTATMTWTLGDPVPAASFIIEQSREGTPYTLAGTVNGTESTFTATNLDQFKYYTFRVQAVNPSGYGPFSETATARGPYFTVNVNFGSGPSGQGGLTPDYPGYVLDIGQIYGLRTNGFTYGWDADNQAHARFRATPISPDLRWATLNHMQKALPAGRTWEIAVPPGDYRLYIVAGDPDNTDTTAQFDIEGIVTPAITMGTNHWAELTTGANVSDGKLTINNGPSASNNKICFVDILPPEAPAIVGEPQDLAVNEGQAASLTVVATGAPIFYQWYHNGALLPGQTGTKLSFPYVKCSDEGAYFVVASNTFVSVTSRVATVAVAADIVAPEIVSVGSLDGNSIGVVFSEPVWIDAPGFKSFDNWQILDSLISANLYFTNEDGSCQIDSGTGECTPTYYNYPVALVTAWPDPAAPYSDKIILTLNGHFTPNVSGEFTVECFYYADYSCAQNAGVYQEVGSTPIGLNLVDIWQPEPAGKAFVGSTNRFSVTAGGYDIWGNGDQFTFLYKQVEGDFDVRLKLLALPDPAGPIPNGWAKAGLMLRGYIEGTDGIVTNSAVGNATNSMMIYNVATSTNAGAQHTFASGIRYQNNAAAVDTPTAPAWVYRPYIYSFPAELRMVREGSNITTLSYSYVTNVVTNPDTFVTSTNIVGPQWVTNTVATTTNWPGVMYLGIATTSHSQSNGVTASYENFTLIARPVVTLEPVSLVVTSDQAAIFTVAGTGPAVGEPLRYQWFKDGTPIAGANSATLTLSPPLLAADKGTYSAEVRNSAGAVTSTGATLDIKVVPTILAQPSSPTVSCFGNATLSLAVTGDEPISYQWRLHGTNLPGETAATLNVSLLNSLNYGPYSVVLQNAYGTTISSDAYVPLTDPVGEVPPTPQIPINYSTNVQCGVPVSYAWEAYNSCGYPITVVCTPPSGSAFPAGATVVNCSATDAVSGSGAASFTVNAVDTAPPVTVCPPDIIVEATTASAPVSWTPFTAADACAGNLPVICTPTSGSQFQAGTNIVVCTATDPANNTGSCSFKVIVNAPATTVRLAVQISGANVTVSWPKPAEGYTLQYSTSLGAAPAALWENFAGTIIETETSYTATVPATGNQFFRLYKP